MGLLWNAGEIAVDHISFRFWISGAIPKIFAIKVESCQKLRLIFQVFSPSQILGVRCTEIYTNVMTLAWRHGRMENVLWGYSHYPRSYSG